MKHVFISYSRDASSDYAKTLFHSLQERNISAWLDIKHINVGDKWPKEIRNAILASFAFVIIMSPGAEDSEWVNKELQWATLKKVPIIPLLHKDTDFFEVNDLQYEDVRNDDFCLSYSNTFLNESRSVSNTFLKDVYKRMGTVIYV